MTANRTIGLCVVFLAACFWLFVIPNHSSTTDYGWMRPRTLPTICAFSLMGLGALLALFPRGAVTLERREILRVTLLVGLTAVIIWAMSRFGFLAAGPLFVLIVMIFLRESRPLWVLSGVVISPLAIWFITTILLSRPLP